MSDSIKNDITITVTGSIDFSGTVDAEFIVTLPDTPPPTPEPTPPPTPEPTPPPIPSADTLIVELTYQGKVYLFDESFGIDLGDYVEPGGHFVQLCMLTTHPELPGFRVMFRPDSSGQREEIVFELGMLHSGTPVNMVDYTVVIKRADQTVTTIQAPCHYWNSRWRWQSAPRPIIYPVDDLLGNLLPMYSEDLFGSKLPLSLPRQYLGPMDLAGIQPYIPSTGERDEIGICTEGQAEYLCQRTTTAWSSVQAWLEASGTIPWHFRDEKTNAPIDVNEYPQATMYGSSGDPLIKNPTSPITLDVSHMGSFAYVPFVLTGDPYALEEMQFYTTYSIIMQSPSARQNWNLGNAVRAVAWSLRALMHNATVTPDEIPSWLKSKQYFKTLLDQERDWFMSRFVNATTAPFNNLNLVSDGKGGPASPPLPPDTYVSVWMEDFLTAVLGWIVQLGHNDWLPILQWKAADAVARTSGKSGWVRAVPTMYQMAIKLDTNAQVAYDWGACWEANERLQPTKCEYADKDIMPTTVSLTYPSYMLGSLGLAAPVGIADAPECYEWLLEQIQHNTTNNSYIRRRWAVATGPVSV